MKENPTAAQAQARAAAQEMAWKDARVSGWAVRCLVHLLPFQYSASDPAAVHLSAAAQDTADRTAPPAGLGVASIAHVLPFQERASGMLRPEAGT